MEKKFNLEQVLDLIRSIEQAVFPENFETSKDLMTEDFFDLPLCKARELGIQKEYEDFMNADKNFKGEY